MCRQPEILKSNNRFALTTAASKLFNCVCMLVCVKPEFCRDLHLSYIESKGLTEKSSGIQSLKELLSL